MILAPPKSPYPIHGWDGGLATQMSTNGCSRRTVLDWKPGEPILKTRMTVPLETMRAASLHEESYQRMATKHYHHGLGISADMWLRELVNSGVPVSTSRAIDKMVVAALKRAKVQPSDHCARMDQVHAFQAQGHGECDRPDGLIYPLDFGSALMSREIGLSTEVAYGIGDTGATDHLCDSSMNPVCFMMLCLPLHGTRRQGREPLGVTLKVKWM